MKLIIALLFSLNTYASLPPTTSRGIGDTVDSTTFKYRFPNLTVNRTGTTTSLGGGLTTVQKNALTPSAGNEVYDTDLNVKQYYNGTQWVANSSIQLDNLYSAEVTITSGSHAKENKDFIASCSAASPSVCTFNTGYFTTAPNCKSGNVIGTSIQAAHVYNITSNGFTVEAWNTSTGASVGSVAVPISCQKTGSDYQSADAYIASNSNYSATSYAPTIGAGLGTVSQNVAFHERRGDMLRVYGAFVAGTVAANVGSISLPTGLTVDTTKLGITGNTTSNAGTMIGRWNVQTANQFGNIVTAPGTSTSVVYISVGWAGSQALKPSTSISTDAITTNGVYVAYDFEVPIQGWTNSNLIVASLVGTPNVTGSTQLIKQCSFEVGQGTRLTSCSASPCTTYVPMGSCLSGAVTRSASGRYSAPIVGFFTTQYSCRGNTNGQQVNRAVNPDATSLSAIAISTVNGAGAFEDNSFMIECWGY